LHHLLLAGLPAHLCENSNDRRQSINFSQFSAVFHYRLGVAKKFAPDAPISDNFRVFTQPGSILAAGSRPRKRPESGAQAPSDKQQAGMGRLPSETDH